MENVKSITAMQVNIEDPNVWVDLEIDQGFKMGGSISLVYTVNEITVM